MEYTTIYPHVIERWAIADKVETAAVSWPSAEERSLLVFTSEEAAEAFRTETGQFPASEGFKVLYADVDGLRNILRTWGHRYVALAPEAGGADVLPADAFLGLLEEAASEAM